MKKLNFTNIESLSAVAKELQYGMTQYWFDLIQELIDHQLVELVEFEPKVMVPIHTGGYDLAPQIKIKVKLPQRILELESENKDLKNKIDVLEFLLQGKI